MLVRGLVVSVDDTGTAQTVTVKTHDGMIYRDIEVWMPFGFASNPPIDGAAVVLMAIGGDVGHYLALPVSAASRRFGNQANGEAVMYAFDGTRVHCRAGGKVEIWGATEVTVHSKDVAITASGTITLNAGQIEIDGSLHVTGPINATGTIHGA